STPTMSPDMSLLFFCTACSITTIETPKDTPRTLGQGVYPGEGRLWNATSSLPDAQAPARTGGADRQTASVRPRLPLRLTRPRPPYQATASTLSRGRARSSIASSASSRGTDDDQRAPGDAPASRIELWRDQRRKQAPLEGSVE